MTQPPSAKPVRGASRTRRPAAGGSGHAARSPRPLRAPGPRPDTCAAHCASHVGATPAEARGPLRAAPRRGPWWPPAHLSRTPVPAPLAVRGFLKGPPLPHAPRCLQRALVPDCRGGLGPCGLLLPIPQDFILFLWSPTCARSTFVYSLPPVLPPHSSSLSLHPPHTPSLPLSLSLCFPWAIPLPLSLPLSLCLLSPLCPPFLSLSSLPPSSLFRLGRALAGLSSCVSSTLSWPPTLNSKAPCRLSTYHCLVLSLIGCSFSLPSKDVFTAVSPGSRRRHCIEETQCYSVSAHSYLKCPALNTILGAPTMDGGLHC